MHSKVRIRPKSKLNTRPYEWKISAKARSTFSCCLFLLQSSGREFVRKHIFDLQSSDGTISILHSSRSNDSWKVQCVQSHLLMTNILSVTGGTGGLGASLCRTFILARADVVCIDMLPEPPAELWSIFSIDTKTITGVKLTGTRPTRSDGWPKQKTVVLLSVRCDQRAKCQRGV
jgi:hypothetical protein